MKIVRNGAKVRVHMLCNNHHQETWDSSPSLGTGVHQVAEINVLVAVYSLLTGLHIKQVCVRFYHFMCFLKVLMSYSVMTLSVF